LLPHHYVGTCKRCHTIRDTVVTPVDIDTVNRLPLTANERALVTSGQRVLTPTPGHVALAPVLQPDAILPHAFVGVCSNCHWVVDLGLGPPPSPAQLGLAHRALTNRGFTASEIAHAQPVRDYGLRTPLHLISGVVALALFLLSVVYVVLKIRGAALPRAARRAYAKRVHLKTWFRVHEWASVGFAVAVVVHWALGTRGNALLHVSVILVVLLAASGLLHRYKVGTAAVKAPARWVHTQRFFTCLLLVAVVVGHLLGILAAQ